MTALSRAAQAKLAAEIASNRPVPEWDSVSDLKKFKQPITLKGGKTQTLNFEELVVKYKEIDAEIKFRQQIMKDLKEAVEAAILVSGEEKVLCSGYRVSRITKQGSRKIVPEKLLEQGVTPEQIAAATDVGAETSYVEIRRAKED